jgi:hypothetical protein
MQMFRRSSSLLCFVLLWPAAQAQPEPGVLEAAKQDLQDIQASKTDTSRTRVELPSISGPELRGASGPLQGPRAQVGERSTPGKSDNWLLDAMSATDERTEEEEKLLILTGEKTETELQLEKRFRLPGEKIGQTPSTQSQKTKEENRNPSNQPAIDNPLTAFMGDWISQRDHALLLPKATSSPASNSARVSLPMPTDIYQGAGTPITAGFSDEVTAATTSGFTISNDPSENPYLQTFLQPLPESSAMRPEISALGQPRNDPSATSIRRQSDPLVTAGKPLMPVELAKPDEDKKYFPQLKRF